MRRIESVTLAIGLAGLAIVGCADVNSVVGGACATGYVQHNGTCVPASSVNNNNNDDGGLTQDDAQTNPDGATPDTGSGDDGGQPINDPGTSFGGPQTVCPPPEMMCSGFCIDTTSDPDNCGSCGKVCPSNSCVASKCVGAAPGHIVVIGHDYVTSPSLASSQARVLTNATLLPASNPLRVMSYEQYSDATAVKNAEALVNAEAKLLGRSITFVPITSSSIVSSTIDVNTYDVLMVHDQKSAPTGTLATVGTTWSSDGNVASFLHAGGVVIVLTGGTSTGEMPALSTNASLLSISAQTIITGSLTVLAPADAIGSGVVSPYVPKPSTVSLATESNGGNVVWVVAQSGSPVIVHKVVP